MIIQISQQLKTIDIDLSTLRGLDLLIDGSWLHFRVYYQLRELVRRHVLSGQEPLLSETPQPLGGYKSVEEREGYFSGVLQENRAYQESYENEPIQELIFSPDFQDIEEDGDWVNGIDNGLVQQDEVLQLAFYDFQLLVRTENMPILKKFCPESKKEHSKEISFYEDCKGERKALLRPIEAIDLTKSTPLSRTT